MAAIKIYAVPRTTSSIAASTTVYFPAANVSYSSVAANTEANQQIPYRAAGLSKKMTVRVITNSRGASTWKLRIGAANGNQNISIGASTTGDFEDAVNTDNIAAGNLVNYQLVTGAGGAAFNLGGFGHIFSSPGNTVQVFACSDGFSLSGVANTTYRWAIGGAIPGASLAEARVQHKMKTVGTFSNFEIYYSANTLITANTHRFRKNTANGNLVVSVTALTTGRFSDLTNTDAVVDGDLANTNLVTGTSTLAFTSENSSIIFTTTNNKTHYQCITTGGEIHATSVTVYDPMAGRPSVATEADVGVIAGLDFTLSNMAVQVNANTITAASTMTFRKNAGGTATNLTISITASTTGYFEDNIHTDFVLKLDKINFKLVTGATGTQLDRSGSFSMFNSWERRRVRMGASR